MHTCQPSHAPGCCCCCLLGLGCELALAKRGVVPYPPLAAAGRPLRPWVPGSLGLGFGWGANQLLKIEGPEIIRIDRPIRQLATRREGMGQSAKIIKHSRSIQPSKKHQQSLVVGFLVSCSCSSPRRPVPSSPPRSPRSPLASSPKRVQRTTEERHTYWNTNAHQFSCTYQLIWPSSSIDRCHQAIDPIRTPLTIDRSGVVWLPLIQPLPAPIILRR